MLLIVILENVSAWLGNLSKLLWRVLGRLKLLIRLAVGEASDSTVHGPLWVLHEVVNTELIPLTDPELTLLFSLAQNTSDFWVLTVVVLCQRDRLNSFQSIYLSLLFDFKQGQRLDLISCIPRPFRHLRGLSIPFKEPENTCICIVWRQRVKRNRTIGRCVVILYRVLVSGAAEGHYRSIYLATKLMRQILTLIAGRLIRCPLKCEVRVVVDRYGFCLPIAECTSLLQHLFAIAPDQLLTIANFPQFILFIFPLCRL